MAFGHHFEECEYFFGELINSVVFAVNFGDIAYLAGIKNANARAKIAYAFERLAGRNEYSLDITEKLRKIAPQLVPPTLTPSTSEPHSGEGL